MADLRCLTEYLLRVAETAADDCNSIVKGDRWKKDEG
jgi:hypothetical protein